MDRTVRKEIQHIIKDNMMEYGSYVIKNRALPDIRDGLKPVYRRILYAMNKKKCVSFTKSATVTGHVFPYHPHGDTYGTMVGLVQEDNHLSPLIIGKGNFGQHTSKELAPAASRYTEVKLSELSNDIFKGLNKDIVKWIPNYDGTTQMPEVLPVKFPMILHIAQEGIAVGMSSKTPSFNITDIYNSIIKYIKTGEKVLLIPDFATGGILDYDEEVIKRINYFGNGTLRIRGKAKIVDDSIIITEIPYSTTRERIIEAVVKLVKERKIDGITRVEDLTDIKGMKIEITCKKNADKELILAQLYDKTSLEDTYPCNMNVLSNGLPKVKGVWPIIEEWLEWRHECLINLKTGENKELMKELNLLRGFEKVISDIQLLVNIIRFEEDIIGELREAFGLNTEQAEYISNMRLKKINSVYIKKEIDKIKDLEKIIKANNEFISNKSLRDEEIIKDLTEINEKFAQERRTQIMKIDRTKARTKIKAAVDKKEEKDFDVVVYITKEGYIKKVTSDDGDNKLKSGDEILHRFKIKNSSEVIVFSGTDAYKIYVSDLKTVKKSDFGQYIPSLINIDNISGYSVIGGDYKFHLVRYSNDKIAKIDINSFKTETRRRKLSNSLSKVADVLEIIPLKEEVTVEITNAKNKTKEILTSNMDMKTSRAAQGATYWRNIININIK